MAERYIGLMSGTSLDGIDAVLVEYDGRNTKLLTARHQTFSPDLRRQLQALLSPGENEIERMAEADIALAHAYSESVHTLLSEAGTKATEIRAIGSHGQTIRHLPDSRLPTTIQIGDPNTLCELTGIDVVADFRRRDMAAGGQGAPLVPAFHAAAFQQPGHDIAVVNIGGIANITLLPGDSARPVQGFDTGPGNTLCDMWIQRHHSNSYDAGGAWATQGKILTDVLKTLRNDPYFVKAPPKSTGREYFNLDWLNRSITNITSYRAEDIQATLCELTATTICHALQASMRHLKYLLVCGGGIHNQFLCDRLKIHLGEVELLSTESRGIHPDWVEAMAFAWLAAQTIAGKSGNLPAVTGASHPVILGAFYQH